MKIDSFNKRCAYAKAVLATGNPAETKLIDQLASTYQQVIFRHVPVLSAFLDPGQRQLLRMLCGSDLNLAAFGGYNGAEKKRVYLSENASEIAPANYQITVCQLRYPQKFTTLNHSMILGSLANSGVQLNTFGDIITDGYGQWQVMLEKELWPFFQAEIKQVGHNKVSLKELSYKDVLTPKDDSVLITIIASSLRIDAILAMVTKHSRRQIKAAILANLVKLNWHHIADSNIIVKVDDVLSLRNFGRCQIEDIAVTKKSKYKVVLKLWQKKKIK